MHITKQVFLCYFVLEEQCLSVLLHTTWFETIAVFSSNSVSWILQSNGGWQHWSLKRNHSTSRTIIHHFGGSADATRGYFLGYNTVASLFSHNTVSSDAGGHIHKCADCLKCQIELQTMHFQAFGLCEHSTIAKYKRLCVVKQTVQKSLCFRKQLYFLKTMCRCARRLLFI